MGRMQKEKNLQKGKINRNKVNKLVVDFVNQNIDLSRSDDAREYIEVYKKILSNEKLYLSTGQMIDESVSFLKLDKKDIEEVKKLWHDLSRYLHFSYPSLEAIAEDPEFCFLEKLNDELFKRSLILYFQTLDFFYATLVWRFKNLRKEIEVMCEWWRKNFNKKFSLTEKTLNRVKE